MTRKIILNKDFLSTHFIYAIFQNINDKMIDLMN